jgi:hypothetical protein
MEHQKGEPLPRNPKASSSAVTPTRLDPRSSHGSSLPPFLSFAGSSRFPLACLRRSIGKQTGNRKRKRNRASASLVTVCSAGWKMSVVQFSSLFAPVAQRVLMASGN